MRLELFIARTHIVIAELVVVIAALGLAHRLLLILDERNQVIIGEVVDNALLLGADLEQLFADEALGGVGRHEGSVFVVGEGEAVDAERVVAGEMEEVGEGLAAFAAGLALWRLVCL